MQEGNAETPSKGPETTPELFISHRSQDKDIADTLGGFVKKAAHERTRGVPPQIQGTTTRLLRCGAIVTGGWPLLPCSCCPHNETRRCRHPNAEHYKLS